MNITQLDIARLSDNDVRRLVVAVMTAVEGVDRSGRASGGDFWRRFARALVRARRERHLAWLSAEAELVNAGGVGGLVGPGDDPVGDAWEELRRAVRGDTPPSRFDGDGEVTATATVTATGRRDGRSRSCAYDGDHSSQGPRRNVCRRHPQLRRGRPALLDHDH